MGTIYTVLHVAKNLEHVFVLLEGTTPAKLSSSQCISVLTPTWGITSLT